MSPSFWSEAATAVASSGSEVPSATTVRPTASSETPRKRAASAAPSTTILAPPSRAARPMIVSAMCPSSVPPRDTNFSYSASMAGGSSRAPYSRYRMYETNPTSSAVPSQRPSSPFSTSR